MNAQKNVIGLIFAIILAVVAWVLSPDFAAEQFGISEKSFGTIRLVATMLSIVIATYNGYQINAKSKQQ